MISRKMIYTPKTITHEFLKTNLENETGVKLYDIIDPLLCFRANTFDFVLDVITEYVSPNSNQVDFNWRSVCAAIAQMYEDGVALNGVWMELEENIANHSYRRALEGDLSFLKERLAIANLPISKNERNYYPHRDNGRLLRKRGRKPNGPGRYLFARLWLEIVEDESATVANFRMKQHFNVTERHIYFGIARARGGIYEVLMRQLIEDCTRNRNLQDYVREKLRNEYIGLF